MSTNGTGLALNAEARRGAARPSTETPRPLMSATRSALPGEIRAYADANKVSSAAGSSSKRSSDTHATRPILGVGPTAPAGSTCRNPPAR